MSLPQRSSTTVFNPNSSHVLTVDQVATFGNSKIKKVIKVTSVPRSMAIKMLIQLHWDVPKVLRRFTTLNCDTDALLKSAGLYTALLTSYKLLVDPVKCAICHGQCERSAAKIASPCEHAVCPECWLGLVLDRLVFRKSTSESLIKCPHVEPGVDGTCSSSIDGGPKLAQLLKDEEACQRFLREASDPLVSTNPLINWCPSPKKCSNAILVQQKAEQSVRCSCNYAFCFSCLQQPHEPISCGLLSDWNKKAGIHHCPRCRYKIEAPAKNAKGHVVCKNKNCGFQFCWECNTPWESHETNTKCPLLQAPSVSEHTKAVSKSASPNVIKEQNQKKDERNSTKHAEAVRSEHCYHRYKINSELLNTEEILSTTMEMAVMRQLAKELTNYRQAVMHSYVLAYYLVANRDTALFLSHLAELENAANSLSLQLKEHAESRDIPLLILQSMTEKVTHLNGRMRRLLEHAYSIQKPQIGWYIARQKTVHSA